MKFNRISVLNLVGLFTKIKSEDGEYHESRYLKIKAYIMCFAISGVIRMPSSYLYPLTNSNQLFIGNIFNHLNSYSRGFLTLAGTSLLIMLLFLFICFRHLNNKHEKLILMWLKMNDTILIDDNDQFKIVGISKQENKRYWLKRNSFNLIFLRAFYIYLGFLCISFTLPLYFMRYGAKFYIFIMHKLNILFNKFIGISYFHMFVVEIIFCFALIFGDINLKIGSIVVFTSSFFSVLYFPFFLSNKLTLKMRKVNFLLENLSFKSITSYSNKRKINRINSIIKFNDGYVFQCLNLFPLSSNYSFNTGIQIIINVLLLIRISNVLYN